jgi:hypothetical protein
VRNTYQIRPRAATIEELTLQRCGRYRAGMRARLLHIGTAAVSLGSGLCAGCVTWDVQQRSDTVKIVTDPPGAMVWQTDSYGSRKVGPSPTSITKEQEVRVTQATPVCWVMVAAGAVAAGVGLDLYLTRNDDASWVTQASQVSLATAGAVVLASSLPFCISARGRQDAVLPEVVRVSASRDGYADQDMTLSIPGSTDEVFLALHPRPRSAAPQNALPAPPPGYTPGPPGSVPAATIPPATGVP